MNSYEAKLQQFAEGKQLLRLSRPIRDRADASCDVCESTRPRLLYALQDQESGRYYFVGETCLKELVKSGAIRRRYSRESGHTAFETEMERRLEESRERIDQEHAGVDPNALSKVSDKRGGESRSEIASGSTPSVPVLMVIADPRYYRAVACVFAPNGTTLSWGYAREARYEEVWSRGGDKGLLLEKVAKERGDAMQQAIVRAWGEVQSYVEESQQCPGNGSIPASLIRVLELLGDDAADEKVIPFSSPSQLEAPR